MNFNEEAIKEPMPETKPTTFKIDYLGGFKLLFQDRNTLNNILIASLYVLIPIIGSIILMGWYCEIVQRLCRRDPQPVPKQDFADFTHYLGRGIAPFVASLIITLPFTFLLIFIIFIGAFGISLAASQHVPGPFLLFSGLGGGAFVFVFIMLPMVVLANAVLTRAYLTEDLGKSLDFKKICDYSKRTWKPLLLAYLVYVPISFGIIILGMIALYIGMYPAIVIINTAWVYMAWQIYEQYLSEGGEPIPLKPLVTLPSEYRPAPQPTPPATP